MANFQASVSGTRYGNGEIPLVLSGAGTQRAIIVIAASRSGGSSSLLSATFGGKQGEILHSALFVTPDASRALVGVALFTETSHPGAGTHDLVLNWESAANVTAVAIEVSGWAAQDALHAVVHSSAQEAVDGTTYTETVTDSIGALAIAYAATHNGSSFEHTISHSPNLTALPFSGSSMAGVAASYDEAIGASPEEYSQTFNLTAGATGAGLHTGVITLGVAAPPSPSVTVITSTFNPGDTVSLTLANFSVYPTEALVIDTDGTTLTLPLTQVSGDEHTFVMPDVPAAGTSKALLKDGVVIVRATGGG